jgi:hypothetical protein
LQFGARDALLNALLLAAKRFSSSPPPTCIATARDPATANRFETAPFTAAPGASTGGAEIDEGEFTRAPENAGGGEGGEFTVRKEGEWKEMRRIGVKMTCEGLKERGERREIFFY